MWSLRADEQHPGLLPRRSIGRERDRRLIRALDEVHAFGPAREGQLDGARLEAVERPRVGCDPPLGAPLNLDVAHVHFVPTDFNLGHLDAAMPRAGFEPLLPTLVLWEGTTNYLSAEAVDATLHWCARAPAGSQLVFTDINADVLDDPNRYVGAEQVFSTLRRADGPMTFGLAPHALADYLAERGLRLVADIGAETFRRQTYGTASAVIRGHEFYRVAHARIASSTALPADDHTAGRP
jgi:hypothetical protein